MISGLTLSTTGKLTCRLYPSVSTITYPVIVVTGFDRVYSGTQVVVGIAGLKSLAADVSSYIKVGVSLQYYDYGGVKGYSYEPTGIVVGPPTAASPLAIASLTVTETSTNFVGDLVNYTFTGTLGAGFSPVTSTDYVMVEF